MPDWVVHIVDDEEPARNALAFLLAVHGFTVRTHVSGEAFLDMAPSVLRGCLLTDLRMPELDGIALLRRLRLMGVRIPVIVMTGHGDVPRAVTAMKAGAFDFIEKPFEDQILLRSLREAAEAGNSGCDGDIAIIDRKLALLTAREREVLSHLVAGLPNKAIGHDLSISPRTVEVHRANIMAKMQARSLAELVRMAVTAGVPAMA
ncbi:MAG: response regulator [Phyllobacteriaceae bacterium]|nr:response regulator [Phyllobacteriaceae bacterium]